MHYIPPPAIDPSAYIIDQRVLCGPCARLDIGDGDTLALVALGRSVVGTAVYGPAPELPPYCDECWCELPTRKEATHEPTHNGL